MKTGLILVGLVVLVASGATGLDLGVQQADLRIEQSAEGGYYFYVRKKPDIQSVLLAETTKDPKGQLANYAYRDPVYHPANGDEKQLLNGKFLDKKNRYTLISSTVVDDKQFGKAFRIFIPFVVIFGYPDSRYGEIQIQNGLYINVRTFEKPYGDYDTGTFRDNPFEIAIAQKPLDPPPTDENKYMKETVKAFSSIAKDTDGLTFYAKDKDDAVKQIEAALKSVADQEFDLVLCIDATKSMEDDMPTIRQTLVPMLTNLLKSSKKFRIGLIQYRDYFEDFLYQESPFTTDLGAVQKFVDRIRPFGGGDIPEAVNETLYAAIKDYQWLAANRLVILIGDAPPHPIPRGSVSQDMVVRAAKEAKLRVETIILPQ